MSEISIAIIDDHEIVRKGLLGFLEMIDDFNIVAEGSTGTDAVRISEEYKPDVILLDMMMPEMNGVEATRAIVQSRPDARILILTSFIDEETLFPALEAGATGFVLKDIAPDELVEAVRKTSMGQSALHPDIAVKLLNKMRHPESSPDNMQKPSFNLTDREQEVLELICKGQSNKEIGDTLSISPTTVKTHVSNILSKLNLLDRTQAAVFAIRNGLIPED